MSNYPNLLSPLKVGNVTLPNRMVMGSMHTRLETSESATARLAAFYAARATGEIGLIITGGYSPNSEGVMHEGGPLLDCADQLAQHRIVTSAVHEAGGRMVLQILHAGRYAKIPGCVAPSPSRARINTYAPRALATDEVWSTIESFARTAALAQQAGYVGVEIMGSEGYLINQFTSAAVNWRGDEFGGDLKGRMRFPLEIVKAVRSRVGRDFMLIYRLSAIDLMEGGMTGPEVAELAHRVARAGADMINTGVGWHESAVPTIAACVPRAAWSQAVRNVKESVSIPVMASNRISTPEIAEQLIASGAADAVSMARPLLADPAFAKKTREDRADEINTCIGCNQACLDRIFTERTVTCLVNPRAGRELDFKESIARQARRLAVVGGGVAGMAFALDAARRGHLVTLFEADRELGGQLNLAKRVPGKNEFRETLRYFSVSLQRAGVDVRLSTRAGPDELVHAGYEAVILATGVQPRVPNITGIDHPKVLTYSDVLKGKAIAGERVAIIGAGGIGFDVAEFLVGNPEESLDVPTFLQSWGVDPAITTPGGLVPPEVRPAPRHQVHMLQRRSDAPGKHLGKSTGWISKTRLRQAGVRTTVGVRYEAIDDQGLHYVVDGERRVMEVDSIVVCAGQESDRTLYEALRGRGVVAHTLGGAESAAEIDALRAIEQAVRLAASI